MYCTSKINGVLFLYLFDYPLLKNITGYINGVSGIVAWKGKYIRLSDRVVLFQIQISRSTCVDQDLVLWFQSPWNQVYYKVNEFNELIFTEPFLECVWETVDMFTQVFPRTFLASTFYRVFPTVLSEFSVWSTDVETTIFFDPPNCHPFNCFISKLAWRLKVLKKIETDFAKRFYIYCTQYIILAEVKPYF